LILSKFTFTSLTVIKPYFRAQNFTLKFTFEAVTFTLLSNLKFPQFAFSQKHITLRIAECSNYINYKKYQPAILLSCHKNEIIKGKQFFLVIKQTVRRLITQYLLKQLCHWRDENELAFTMVCVETFFVLSKRYLH
jgi:hypothetical protein